MTRSGNEMKTEKCLQVDCREPEDVMGARMAESSLGQSMQSVLPGWIRLNWIQADRIELLSLKNMRVASSRGLLIA